MALFAATGYGAYAIVCSFATRTIQVCAVTDFNFRDQKPNWEHSIKVWFAEVNRMFEPAGIRWELALGGEAYPERTEGRLVDRRRLIEDTNTCQADLILGFTGQPDSDTNSSVSPFGHTAVVAITAQDPDAIAVTTLGRALGNLFGVSVGTQTVILTDAPESEALDTAALRLIRTLRRYNFARGVAALNGRWEQRGFDALREALAGRSPNPAAQAHRILARAFADGRKHPAAIAHYREGVRAAPQDASQHFELALELEADSHDGEAIRELREAARLDPEDARPHAAIGAICLNNRHIDQAIDELRIATRMDPLNPGYQSVLGKALSAQMGSVDEAAAAYEAALRLKPHEHGALSGLDALTGIEDESKQLVRDAESEVRGNPNSSDAHLRLGLAQAAAGNLESAGNEFQRSIALDPRNGLPHLAMARLHYLRAQYAEANTQLEAAKAAGADPGLDFVNALQRKLAGRVATTSRTF